MRQLGCYLLCALAAVASDDAMADSFTEAPRFSRHVEAVFSRAGCNAGKCHGAVQGKNGFRLSLFAGNPAADHDQLVYASRGRRIALSAPSASLLLQKATNQLPHGGGQTLQTESLEHQILLAWIEQGATLDDVAESRLAALTIEPTLHTARPGEDYTLRVTARFADGTIEDVTRLSTFSSLDPSIATVDRDGRVRAEGIGDTALVARFRAEPVQTMIVVPRPGNEPFPAVAAHNFIDEHVLAKLRRLNVPPAPLADDETFLRRASLDVAGELPTPAEIRAFLASGDPDKRAKKIDELLARPGHAALWTLKFCDILQASDFGVYADALKLEDDAPRFQAWIRARLEENTPYDQLVERILTATSREGRSLEAWTAEVEAMFTGATEERKDIELYRQRRTLDLYWQRRAAAGVPGALQVAHAFLGLRLECAQCHRHPHDVWQQDDLLSFANFFTRIREPGFQGDNEKKYPETAAVHKKYEQQGKAIAEEIKQVKETRLKTLEAAAKQDKSQQGEYENARQEVARLERRSHLLPEIGKRILHAEISHLATSTAKATIKSPLGTQSSETFRLLGESEPLVIAAEIDPRGAVLAWMRRPDNPYFARAIVNRAWAHYFGRGIVDPPDQLSPLNPATHPELLDALSREFVAHGYDLRWLHHTIVASRTYQASSQPSDENRMDRANYAYFHFRRIGAEVLVDAINSATGTSEAMGMKYHRWPEELRTVEIPFAPQNEFVKFMLEQFGRPARNSAIQCDCQRDGTASVLQVLSLANHPRMIQKLKHETGTVASLVKDESLSDDARIEELFLRSLSRLPTDVERTACGEYLQSAPSPAEGYQGILWSLLNTREFVLQH